MSYLLIWCQSKKDMRSVCARFFKSPKDRQCSLHLVILRSQLKHMASQEKTIVDRIGIHEFSLQAFFPCFSQLANASNGSDKILHTQKHLR